MPLPRTQFAVWLRGQIFSEARCRKIIIRHATATARIGQILFSIDVPDLSPDDGNWDEWITEQVNTIESLTQADADASTTGVEKYVIQVFHNEDNIPSATFSIRMASLNPTEDDGILSEPATKSGLLAQLMRHLEAVTRINTVGMANVLKTQSTQINKFESVIEKLLNEKFDNIELIEQLISRRHERELEEAKAIHDMEVKDKLFDKGMSLLPVIANRVLNKGNGQKALPEPTSPIEEMIDSLAGSITEEQLTHISKLFSPDQQILLFELFKTVGEKKQKLLQKPDNESKE